jgi:hypothetical protein
MVTCPSRKSRSPWQFPYVELLIGSVRRECLDHLIVANEEHLRRILSEYFVYYHEARTRFPLDRSSPIPRSVQPPAKGKVVANRLGRHRPGNWMGRYTSKRIARTPPFQIESPTQKSPRLAS